MYKIILLIVVFFSGQMVSAMSEPANSVRGGVTILTVGTDQVCNFSRIQDAIEASFGNVATEIRITTQQIWTEKLQINNKTNLRLYGGYENCGSSSAIIYTTQIEAVFNIFDTLPAVTIIDSQQISLRRVAINNTPSNGGMIILNSQVSMGDMRFINNRRNSADGSQSHSFTGGGLKVSDNSDVSVSSSLFSQNSALNGGAISCNNSQLEILNSRISYNYNIDTQNNLSFGKGGGIYASNSCVLDLNSFLGGLGTNNTTGINISNNTANYQGGGLYADDGAIVRINQTVPLGTSLQLIPTLIRNNNISEFTSLANSGGAGIMARGSDTSISAYHLVLYGNSIDSTNSSSGGHAIRVDQGASFSIRVRQPGNDCASAGLSDNRENSMCNHIINNKGATGNKGSIYIATEATAEIYQTLIKDNHASEGIVGHINGAFLSMQGNIITSNGNSFFGGGFFGGGDLFKVKGYGNLTIDFTTFRNNHLGSALFPSSSYVISTQSANAVRLSRSIIDESTETRVFENSLDTFSQFKCLLTHEDDFIIGGTNIIVDSPVFQASWPYHLAANSPGLAMCLSTDGILPIGMDIDGEERGYCSTPPCLLLRYDVGADEYYGDDLIFKNGFASIL